MLGGAGHQVLFVQHLLRGQKAQGAGDLPPAFLQLLGEIAGAAGGAVEVRLKPVVDPEQQVHGANGLASGDHVLHISCLLQVEGRRACRKDAPVDGVGERLFRGKWKIRRGREQRRKRLREHDQGSEKERARSQLWIPYQRQSLSQRSMAKP